MTQCGLRPVPHKTQCPGSVIMSSLSEVSNPSLNWPQRWKKNKKKKNSTKKLTDHREVLPWEMKVFLLPDWLPIAKCTRWSVQQASLNKCTQISRIPEARCSVFMYMASSNLRESVLCCLCNFSTTNKPNPVFTRVLMSKMKPVYTAAIWYYVFCVVWEVQLLEKSRTYILHNAQRIKSLGLAVSVDDRMELATVDIDFIYLHLQHYTEGDACSVCT